MDRALDSIPEGLRFDSKCWPCIEVSGKLLVLHCLSPPGRNGYLVYRLMAGSIVAGCIGTHLARGKVKCTCVVIDILCETNIFTCILRGDVSAILATDHCLCPSCRTVSYNIMQSSDL